jgi:hypothetical protein
LITHTATGIGFNAEFGRRLRGWSREQWDAAVDGLRARGLLDDASQITESRRRAALEDRRPHG